MKKQCATISILILFLVLSNSSIKVSAGCGRPKCTGNVSTLAPGAPPTPAQDVAQQTVPAAQPEASLGLVLLAVRWAMSFPYFL